MQGGGGGRVGEDPCLVWHIFVYSLYDMNLFPLLCVSSFIFLFFYVGNIGIYFNFQVAYVLGQLQNKAASAALSNILRDVNEHPMVRHEAAEALGSIAGMTTWYQSVGVPCDFYYHNGLRTGQCPETAFFPTLFDWSRVWGFTQSTSV